MLNKPARNKRYNWMLTGLLTLSMASIIVIQTLEIGTPFLTAPALY